MSEDEAALIFLALGVVTRIRIVGMLEEHELCAADLLKSVSIVQSTLSHHMKILCDSGTVNCRREGRWSYYSINAEVMEKAADYLKKYRKAGGRIWETFGIAGSAAMRCQMKADFVNTAAQRLSGKLRVHSARRNLVCFHLVETAVRRDRAHAASLELMSRAAGAYQCQMLKRV